MIQFGDAYEADRSAESIERFVTQHDASRLFVAAKESPQQGFTATRAIADAARRLRDEPTGNLDGTKRRLKKVFLEIAPLINRTTNR